MSLLKESYEIFEVYDDDGHVFKLCGDGNVAFSPPLYVQRYLKTVNIIKNWSSKSKIKVSDLGCAELKFFTYLKSLPNITEVMMVDIDEELLNNHKKCLEPLPVDYLFKREIPFHVKVLATDICSPTTNLDSTDVVVMIEVIEHIVESKHPQLLSNIFSDVKPELVIITTPNADFNIFLPGFSPTFIRHFDHKFEWSKSQFRSWCYKICRKYPYKVQFTGCGLGPNNIYCSQIAVFIKQNPNPDNKCATDHKISEPEILDDPGQKDIDKSSNSNNINVVYKLEYPFNEVSEKEKIHQVVSQRFHQLWNSLINISHSCNFFSDKVFISINERSLHHYCESLPKNTEGNFDVSENSSKINETKYNDEQEEAASYTDENDVGSNISNDCNSDKENPFNNTFESDSNAVVNCLENLHFNTQENPQTDFIEEKKNIIKFKYKSCDNLIILPISRHTFTLHGNEHNCDLDQNKPKDQILPNSFTDKEIEVELIFALDDVSSSHVIYILNYDQALISFSEFTSWCFGISEELVLEAVILYGGEIVQINDESWIQLALCGETDTSEDECYSDT